MEGGGEYEDAPSVFREVMRTARKRYRCGECRQPIEPGARYEYVFGVWDGQSDTHRTCAPCAEIRRTAVCGAWLYGELWESLTEGELITAAGGPAACLLRELSAEAAEKVKIEWRRHADREAQW